jgi:hypothetical protein
VLAPPAIVGTRRQRPVAPRDFLLAQLGCFITPCRGQQNEFHHRAEHAGIAGLPYGPQLGKDRASCHVGYRSGGTLQILAMRLRGHRPSKPALRPSLLLHHTDLTCQRVPGGRAATSSVMMRVRCLPYRLAISYAHDVKGAGSSPRRVMGGPMTRAKSNIRASPQTASQTDQTALQTPGAEISDHRPSRTSSGPWCAISTRPLAIISKKPTTDLGVTSTWSMLEPIRLV